MKNLELELELELEPEAELEPEPKPELKHIKHSLKSREEFLNKIVNEEIIINEEMFRNYFNYQNPSSLTKDLFKADISKNNEVKYLIINELIKLME